jgi:hypothetical protein
MVPSKVANGYIKLKVMLIVYWSDIKQGWWPNDFISKKVLILMRHLT